MESALIIEGGRDVIGEVQVSGSKSAGLPLMAAALLASGQSVLEDIPKLSDVDSLSRILRYLGADVAHGSDALRIDTTNLQCRDIPNELTRTLQASVLTLGPLLARFGYGKISPPGGCAIGKRSIEEHIKGFEKLGAQIRISSGSIEARVPSHGLRGAVLRMQTPTVTGTMNLMFAACTAHGVTEIHNAACEPEVADLTKCLMGMGVTIHGIGTNHLTIYGRDELLPYHYRVMEDRIEGGTFLILGAVVGNPLIVHGCRSEHQTALIKHLRAIGAQVDIKGQSITVHKATKPVAVNVKTGPHPSFPTDL